MAQYVTIRVENDARHDARVTKAKLGLTWTDFLLEAATTLDPEEGGN